MINQKVLKQIERIKTKLYLAQEKDQDFEVFAADSHEYVVGQVVENNDILKFEKDYEISLPECYKAFLLNVGNGGKTSEKSAAGPGYGIFTLGKNIAEFVYSNPKKFLKQDCRIHPKMSDDFWKELNKKIDENISDEEFEYELGKIFSGILPIGTEGCTYYYGLVLNGEFKGRVVNIDIDRRKPYFAFETNFLDWYERWLDEITEGTEGFDADLFNYTLGGAVSHILDVYAVVNDKETKLECLTAILRKKNIDSKILNIFEKEYHSNENGIQKKSLQILAKFDYNRAFPYLADFAKKDLLTVFQFVFWYAKNRSLDWLEFVKTNIEKVNDEETFRFCTYLLKEMKIDYGDIIVPFAAKKDENIRRQTYYSLGLLENKSKYIDAFIIGLNDDSNKVVHSVLQALDGVDDDKLLVHYKSIAEKFPTEQDYILINLNHRLKAFGLTNETIKKNINSFL
ncbi:SMI1/KNR4 family protein [Flavobacterium procerum]|uniref:SMI1/KNR4 family protein n=1 Tax=Flavobacterium procerum TaxID=1455569 RepID=A0ABV6BNT9_9FLAO